MLSIIQFHHWLARFDLSNSESAAEQFAIDVGGLLGKHHGFPEMPCPADLKEKRIPCKLVSTIIRLIEKKFFSKRGPTDGAKLLMPKIAPKTT